MCDHGAHLKTILLTGGTGDLGSVVVKRLQRFYRCGVLYRSADSWKRLQTEIGEAGNVVGVPSVDEVATLAPLFGVVHMAGGFAAGSAPKDFERMIEINLMTAVNAIDASLPHMERNGRIVAISSAASLAKPSGLAAYNASKAALNSYIETLAKELKDRGITANALLPTTLDTPANRKGSERLVKRENVAEMIALLLSEQGASITGQLIGMSA